MPDQTWVPAQHMCSCAHHVGDCSESNALGLTSNDIPCPVHQSLGALDAVASITNRALGAHLDLSGKLAQTFLKTLDGAGKTTCNCLPACQYI